MKRPVAGNLEEIRYVICSDNKVRHVKDAFIFELEEYVDELEKKLAYIKTVCTTGCWADDAGYIRDDILDMISGESYNQDKER